MPAITVPIRPPRPAQVLSVKVLGGQGFPPLAFAALVRTTDDNPEDLVLLSMEVPLVCALPDNLTKERLERICVDRVAADLARDDSQEPWVVIGRGDDPPDFRVRVGEEQLGVELTAFTSHSRRRGHAEFRRVRSALLEAGPLGFEHLRGHLIYFWADVADRPDGVAAPQDRTEILRGLREFRPAPNPLGDDPSEPFPDVMPDLGVGNTEPWHYLAVPWEGAHSAAYTLLGFDIGVCLESSHSTTDASKEVTRIITSHDIPGSDVLVVQVGAPDQHGLIYPTDEVIMDLAMGDLRRYGVELTHVRRLLVHFWHRGEVVEVPTNVAT